MKGLSFVFFFCFSFYLSAQKVSSIYDGEYDFSGAKTYDWSLATKRKMKKFINIPYGSREIIKHFEKYQYTLNSDDPQLIVDIDIKQSKSVELQKSSSVRTNRRHYSRSPQVRKPEIVQDHKGTFTFKLIDPKTNHAIWLATSTMKIDDDVDVEKRQKKVTKLIKKMFKKFPGKK